MSKNTMIKNLLSKVATPVSASRSVKKDPLQKFMFEVSIPGMPTMGFQKVDGLEREIAVVEYFEGMAQHAYKLTGRESVGEVTLERGVYGDNVDNAMLDYFKKTLTNPACRSTVTIRLKDRFGATRKTYKLAECWASKWEGTDADASSDDVAIETLTLQFEYFLD